MKEAQLIRAKVRQSTIASIGVNNTSAHDENFEWSFLHLDVRMDPAHHLIIIIPAQNAQE